MREGGGEFGRIVERANFQLYLSLLLHPLFLLFFSLFPRDQLIALGAVGTSDKCSKRVVIVKKQVTDSRTETALLVAEESVAERLIRGRAGNDLVSYKKKKNEKQKKKKKRRKT